MVGRRICRVHDKEEGRREKRREEEGRGPPQLYKIDLELEKCICRAGCLVLLCVSVFERAIVVL